MNRNLASAVHWTNLEPGTIYRFKSSSLGEVMAKFLGGDQFEITEGMLRSPATKKTWKTGDIFAVPHWGVCELYEIADIK